MFISFEGIDCSGKSTQSHLLAEYLRKTGKDVVEVREPGNTQLSEHIREILLSKSYDDINERTELLLFAAARAQLVGEVILPAIHAGKIVVCDRFSDSTVAYQGYGRGLPLDDIIHINRIASQETDPDMTFYLDISPETALKRSAKRDSESQDRMEDQGVHFFEKVIEGYMQIANRNTGRYYVVDGGEEIEEIHHIISRLADQRLDRSVGNTTPQRNEPIEPLAL